MTSQADPDANTIEFSTPPDDQNYSGAAMAVDIGAATHQGHVRSNNEDHYLVTRVHRSLENLYTNLDAAVVAPPHNLTGYGLLVADGLGGMAAGEVASRIALTKLVDLVVKTPDWIMGLKRTQHAEAVLARMTDRFMKIDATLKKHADQDDSLGGMGTTLTVALNLANDLIIGHVGDSRAYLFSADRLSQLTKDHTLAQTLIDAGVASNNEFWVGSHRHVLTAALGSLDSHSQPEVQRLKLGVQDQLLLCTDGLTEMVDDKIIASVLRDANSAQRACDELITLALAGGGLDNITVIVARFGPPATVL